MPHVVYSAAARADLVDIWSYVTENAGTQRGDAVIDRIVARIAVLAEQPPMGPMRPDIAPQARSLVVERWLALYRLDVVGVHIVPVVDGTRDLRRVAL